MAETTTGNFALIVDLIDAWKNDDLTRAETLVNQLNSLTIDALEKGSINDSINLSNNMAIDSVNSTYTYIVNNLNCVTDRDYKLKFAHAAGFLAKADKENSLTFIMDTITESTETFKSYATLQYCSVLIRICLYYRYYDELNLLRDKFA